MKFLTTNAYTTSTLTKNKLATKITALALALVSTSVLATVGTPGFTSENQSYSYVTVDTQGNGSYKKLVQRNSQIDINIGWTMWTGSGSSYEVYFDDKKVNSGSLSSGTSGNIAFPYTGEAGAYDLTLKFCEDNSCKTSAVKKLIIADTDGAHLPPLTMTTNPRNKKFAKTDSVAGAYFVEWGVYGRDFDVSDIPADNLTHLIYGFIPVCGSNASLAGSPAQALSKACADSEDYEVVIHDPWAALQMSFPGVAYGDPIKGIYSQLMALKQRNPDLKILPSIGGWTLSDPLFGFTEKANRDVFVTSVAEFLRTWKFYDGVDIDWEFPGGDGANTSLGDVERDGDAYIALMKELRAMLDILESETGRDFELTSAIGVGADKIEDVNYGEAQIYMDYIFNMSYDFYGAWSNVTGHQTGLYCGSSKSTEECAGTGIDAQGKAREYPAYTTHAGVEALLAQGVEPGKIVLGAAMYGRSWTGAMPANAINDDPMTITNASGPLTGSSAQGIWEAGVIDYKGIYDNMIGVNGTGINGWEVGYDEVAEAAYVWNRTTGGLISYDNARSVKAKGDYVKKLGLGGLFAWEIDADNGDILNAMRESLPVSSSENETVTEPETTPEIITEPTPETKPETKPEVIIEPTPEPKPETKPEVIIEPTPETKPVPTPSENTNAYLAGTSYASGDIVSLDGKLYKCKQGGWCSQGGAYELGTDSGWASSEAWTLVGDAPSSPAEQPTEVVIGVPGKLPTEQPAEVVIGVPGKLPTEQPTEVVIGVPGKLPTEQPAEVVIGVPGKLPTEQPTEEISTPTTGTPSENEQENTEEVTETVKEVVELPENTTEVITITATKPSVSGGSMGWFVLPLLGLALHRKVRKKPGTYLKG